MMVSELNVNFLVVFVISSSTFSSLLTGAVSTRHEAHDMPLAQVDSLPLVRVSRTAYIFGSLRYSSLIPVMPPPRQRSVRLGTLWADVSSDAVPAGRVMNIPFASRISHFESGKLEHWAAGTPLMTISARCGWSVTSSVPTVRGVAVFASGATT